jgi:hypothetical protein
MVATTRATMTTRAGGGDDQGDDGDSNSTEVCLQSEGSHAGPSLYLLRVCTFTPTGITAPWDFGMRFTLTMRSAYPRCYSDNTSGEGAIRVELNQVRTCQYGPLGATTNAPIVFRLIGT